MKYGVVINQQATDLADDIQSYASSLLMPQVDYYIDREEIGKFQSKNNESVAVLMAGWWLNKKWNWPPSKYIIPKMMGMSIDKNGPYSTLTTIGTEWLNGVGGEYFAENGPVGLSNNSAVEMFDNRNIKHYFSGNVAITLPKQKKTDDNNKYIVTVGIEKYINTKVSLVAHSAGLKHKILSHNLNYINLRELPSVEKRFKNVEDFLTELQNAKLVITKSITDCYACLAMDVPVLFLKNKKTDEFNGNYRSWIKAVSKNELFNGSLDSFLKNPEKNNKDFLKTKNSFISEVNKFIDDTKDINEVPTRSFSEEDALEYQNNIKEIALEGWLTRARAYDNQKTFFNRKLALFEKSILTIKESKLFGILMHYKRFGIKSTLNRYFVYNRHHKKILNNPKVGIVSINSHTKVLNFASPLHSYAFQQFLFKNNVDNIIVDYVPCYQGKFDIRHPYDFYLNNPLPDPEEQKKELNRWKELYKEREIRFDKMKAFSDKYYVQTDKTYTQEMLDVEDVGCDIYTCVTDIIWKYNPKNGFDRGYFLDCKTMENKPKIAYAASRGANSYTPMQEKKFLNIIKKFDYVAAREKSFYRYINASANKKTSLVVDPVFLMPKKFYKDLAVMPKRKGYVLLYTVMEENPELLIIATEFAKKHNLEVIELSEDIQNKNIPEGTTHDIIYGIGVEEWLGYMLNADYIFTNSFHCCCFSIIFNKQFFVGKRDGDKVTWLINLFKLQHRKVSFQQLPSEKKINFTRTNRFKRKYAKASKKFMLNAINEIKKGSYNSIEGIENKI